MKVGLFITTQLYSITQAGYTIGFEKSVNGVVRVEITKPGESDFYDAIHCGKPGGTREDLEKDVIKALAEFRSIFSIPNAEFLNEASDTGSESKDGGEREEPSEGDEELDNTGALA